MTLLMEVFRHWNFIEDFYLILFCRNFRENRQIWASKPHLGKLGVTHDLGWWLVGKPIIQFVFDLIELSSLSITVPELWLMRRKVYSSAVFEIVSLHSNFTWAESSPSTIKKLETLGYPMMKTASLCVPSFWHNNGVWRTDRRTDGYAVYSACKASFAARCKKWQLTMYCHLRPRPTQCHCDGSIYIRYATPHYSDGTVIMASVYGKWVKLLDIFRHLA